MGQITVDQSLAVLTALATNVDWSQIDFEGHRLQDMIIRDPKTAGEQFTSFLKNGGRVIIGEPKIIPIDRTKPFDPATFLGTGWKIDEPEDERSLALASVDLTQIRLVSMLRGKETSIQGEEKLKRLKDAKHIRLDAKVFHTLWENQHLIPVGWKEKTNGNTTYIFFDGTVLRDPGGYRCVLYLCFGGGQWGWDCGWRGSSFGPGDPSATLASI